MACFSVAEVPPVSMVAVWGRAVVIVVSCWPASVAAKVSMVSKPPRRCALYAKKLAQRAHNTLILAFLVLLGELFRGRAVGAAVLGEVFRANRPAPVLEAARHPPDRWRRGRALRWCNAQSADHLAHNCPFSSFLLRWSVIWTQRCLVWRACSCANPLLRAVTRYLAHGRCCPGS